MHQIEVELLPFSSDSKTANCEESTGGHRSDLYSDSASLEEFN